MEKYERLKELKEEDFKRLVGVKLSTFNLMLEVYQAYHKKKKSKGGKPNKLSVAMQLLLMLEYYREYRTLHHIAFDYQIGKSTAGENSQRSRESFTKFR